MTEQQEEAIVRYNQFDKQLDKIAEKERKLKQVRKIALYVFLTSLLIVVVYQVITNSEIFESKGIYDFLNGIPGNGILFIVLSICAFIFLLVTVFKAIGASIETEKLRAIQGRLAEKAFRMMQLKQKS